MEKNISYSDVYDGADFNEIDKRFEFSEDSPLDSIERVSAGLYFVLKEMEEGAQEIGERIESCSTSLFDELMQDISGSTAIPSDLALSLLERLLGFMEGELDDNTYYSAIKENVLKGRISFLKREDTTYLSLRNTFLKEKFSAGNIKSRLSTSPALPENTNLYKVIEECMAEKNCVLSQEQITAVKMVLENNFSILTGGPGTGKTQTLNVIVEAYSRIANSKSVCCLAPTGQAAYRMSSLIGIKAQTIHSALGLGIEKGDEAAKTITEGLLIIDESSMVDSNLLYQVLKNTSPLTRILLCGDVDQLASVGAGNVLEELIASDKVPVTRLTKIFRQKDNSIAYNSAKLKIGNSLLDIDKDFKYSTAVGSENIQKRVLDKYRTLVKAGEDVVVLTPFRKYTKTGVDALNSVLRKAVTNITGVPYITNDNGIKLYRGDKVVFLKNRFGLTNGSIGTIERIEKGVCYCRFGDKKIALQDEALCMIDPAFAQTVHKAQGMEYPTVLIVADSAHSRLASRKIYYTALTRAKKKVIIVGEKDAFDKAVDKVPSPRISNLSYMLSTL